MHTHLNPTTTPQQLAARAALHDAAKARALQMRREAINDLWSAIGRSLRSTPHRVRAVLRSWSPGDAATQASRCPCGTGA